MGAPQGQVSPMSTASILGVGVTSQGRDGPATHGQDARATVAYAIRRPVLMMWPTMLLGRASANAWSL